LIPSSWTTSPPSTASPSGGSLRRPALRRKGASRGPWKISRPRNSRGALHLLRHAKGWTLRELEHASGIAVNTICAYKSRRRRPPLAAVERLLIAMGCTWEPPDLVPGSCARSAPSTAKRAELQPYRDRSRKATTAM